VEEVRAAIQVYSTAELFAASQSVRDLKQRNASKEAVQSAIAAYVALEKVSQAELAASGSLEHKSFSSSATNNSSATADVVPAMDLQKAHENILTLKRRFAQREEVKAAIDGLIALERAQGIEQARSPAEQAADVIRALKAKGAPPTEVKAAVQAYTKLELEAAMDNIRILKIRFAHPAEIKKAIEQLVVLEESEVKECPLTKAAASIRALKARRAPLAGVAEAVAAYSALELSMAAEHIRSLKHQFASKAQIASAITIYTQLELSAACDRVRALQETKASEGVLHDARLALENLKPNALQHAAELIRDLKARGAPVDEIRAAIDAYCALEPKPTGGADTPKEDDAPPVVMHLPGDEASSASSANVLVFQ